MTATDIAAATFARIVALQDQVEALADELGKALDENRKLKLLLESNPPAGTRGRLTDGHRKGVG